MAQIKAEFFTHIQQDKYQLYKLLFIFLFVFIQLVGWQYLTQTLCYLSIENLYTKLTGQLTVSLANLFGQYPAFDPLTYNLSINNTVKALIMPTAAYRFYVAGCMLLFVVPIKEYKYLLLLISSSLLLITLRASTISIILLIYPQNTILLLWIDPLIYIPMLAIIIFIVNKNKIIKPFYRKIRLRFSQLLNVQLTTLILLLLIVTPIPRVVLNYVDKGLIDGLASITLRISKFILSVFGYDAVVTTKFIFLGKFWLRLDQPCLGIGVFTIITILICAIKGKMVNKSIFLIVFSLLFVLMNSIRMSVLLVVIKNTYMNGLNKVELHDNITYIMYLFAFLSFITYYFWFQDIDFGDKIKKRMQLKS